MFHEQAYMSVASVEEKGLLENSDSIDGDHEQSTTPVRTSKKSWIMILVHMVLCVLYLVAFVHLWQSWKSQTLRPTQKYALARETVGYELRYFEDPEATASTESKAWLYAGKPRPELEAAWADLLKNTDIKLTPMEMRHLGREHEGMRLADGSGYYAQMTVHHNLHCLRSFHKFMNVNHYFSNITIEEYQMLQLHNVHCVEMLRNAIMCHGDTTPLTMNWNSKLQIAEANWTTPHECVNWQALDEWAADRHVDVHQPGVFDIEVSGGEEHSAHEHGRLPIVIDLDR